MKRIKIDSVLPGDILFTARRGKPSKLIRFATNGEVSHAMICVQQGSFIDSSADGVQAWNIQRELFEDDEQVFLFRLKETLRPEVLTQIVNNARAEIGARYSVREAVRTVYGVRKPRSKRQFCSRLVARVYKNAGIELVPDADYCTPEDLRCSPLLNEILIETEQVSDEEIQWWAARCNPIQAMHEAQNSVLDTARSFEPNLESFDDLFQLLVRCPEADDTIAYALQDSGYLDLWKLEVKSHPWRYDSNIIDSMNTSEQAEALKDYCISMVREAYSGGLRYAISLVQLRTLYRQYPRQSFQLEINLYETLVRNDQTRREIAYGWLLKRYPSDLEQYMEQIEPHSTHWYSIIDSVEPHLAALSRLAVANKRSSEVCSSCGDQPTTDYRVVNAAEIMPGVPSLRLCEECFSIRSYKMGNKLMPFLNGPAKSSN